jgi:carboxypeptidase family protein
MAFLRGRLPGVGLVIAGVGACALGCGGQLPAAPGVGLLSGHVYQLGTPDAGEPILTNVMITVQEADGSPQTVMSNGVGFYAVAVRAGTISITASKVGYATRVSSFDLSNSTVLNLSLTPS